MISTLFPGSPHKRPRKMPHIHPYDVEGYADQDPPEDLQQKRNREPDPDRKCRECGGRTHAEWCSQSHQTRGDV